MGELLNIVTPFHKKTPRKYLDRMNDDKVHCILKAKEYEFDYWDGDRRYGYGGYKYDGRWESVAKKLIETYGLERGAYVLDVGCGKGHLLYELQKLGMEVVGFDISKHGLNEAPEEVRDRLLYHRAESLNPFADNAFDLVISLGCLHNLELPNLEQALRGIERAGKNKFVMVESYRNEQEQFNLQCWALTAETELKDSTWVWLFNRFGYTGDYEFIYFE